MRQTEGFNRIPVSRTVLADAETPLFAYAKLAQGPLFHHRLAGKNLVNR